MSEEKMKLTDMLVQAITAMGTAGDTLMEAEQSAEAKARYPLNLKIEQIGKALYALREMLQFERDMLLKEEKAK